MLVEQAALLRSDLEATLTVYLDGVLGEALALLEARLRAVEAQPASVPDTEAIRAQVSAVVAERMSGALEQAVGATEARMATTDAELQALPARLATTQKDIQTRLDVHLAEQVAKLTENVEATIRDTLERARVEVDGLRSHLEVALAAMAANLDQVRNEALAPLESRVEAVEARPVPVPESEAIRAQVQSSLSDHDILLRLDAVEQTTSGRLSALERYIGPELKRLAETVEGLQVTKASSVEVESSVYAIAGRLLAVEHAIPAELGRLAEALRISELLRDQGAAAAADQLTAVRPDAISAADARANGAEARLIERPDDIVAAGASHPQRRSGATGGGAGAHDRRLRAPGEHEPTAPEAGSTPQASLGGKGRRTG